MWAAPILFGGLLPRPAQLIPVPAAHQHRQDGASAGTGSHHCPGFVPPGPLRLLPWVIDPALLANLSATWRCPTRGALLRDLTAYAEALHGFDPNRSVFAPLSNYRVAMVAEGRSGAVYLGVNLEFAELGLAETVHGEQFATASAVLRGETELKTLASLGSARTYCGAHFPPFWHTRVTSHGCTRSYRK